MSMAAQGAVFASLVSWMLAVSVLVKTAVFVSIWSKLVSSVSQASTVSILQA
jgi:hypothetical protein